MKIESQEDVSNYHSRVSVKISRVFPSEKYVGGATEVPGKLSSINIPLVSLQMLTKDSRQVNTSSADSFSYHGVIVAK